MKYAITAFFLSINLLAAFAQETTKEQQKIVSDFIACIKKQNKEKLAAQASYPLRREYPIPPIKNAKEFLERYAEVFDEKLTAMIVRSDPSKDWSAVGWRGIMLLNGELWLDYDGKMIAVNYQSAAEKKRKNELIKADKQRLHESIRDFEKPVLIMETEKFRIRIDDMGEGNYRYASWNIKNKMSGKPDLIIKNGEYIADGTGGNHSYAFTNGDYKYECSVIVMGENDSPPGYLIVYKNGKEILSQRARVVTE